MCGESKEKHRQLHYSLRAKSFHQRPPLFVERLPPKFPTRPLIPILRIPLFAFLAVQVRMHSHAVRRLQLVDQSVSARPVAFRIPP